MRPRLVDSKFLVTKVVPKIVPKVIEQPKVVTNSNEATSEGFSLFNVGKLILFIVIPFGFILFVQSMIPNEIVNATDSKIRDEPNSHNLDNYNINFKEL